MPDDGLTDHCGCCAHRRTPGGCGGPDCPCDTPNPYAAIRKDGHPQTPWASPGADPIADLVAAEQALRDAVPPYPPTCPSCRHDLVVHSFSGRCVVGGCTCGALA